jgi:hypothetical protein
MASPTARRRLPFTSQEDELLRTLVSCHKSDWRRIAKEMPDRSVRQVRERWTNYLAEDVVMRAWNEKEDELLRMKVGELGHRWKHISEFFEGRSEVNVKSRWRLLERRRVRYAGNATSLPSSCWKPEIGGSATAIECPLAELESDPLADIELAPLADIELAPLADYDWVLGGSLDDPLDVLFEWW